MKAIILTLLGTCIYVYTISAQSINMTTGTLNTCSATIYDSGGPGGSYGSNANQIYTICPSTAGQKITLSFIQFDLESNYDFLTVYNGNNLLGDFITFTGNTLPPVLTSTTANGCLTLHFLSDNSINNSGFQITVSCSTPPGSTPLPEGNTSCANADPFCSSNSYNFPNITSTTAPVGPDYGCLLSQPNPAWYFMSVSTAGSIIMDVVQTQNANGTGAQLDVDFALWGPFSSTAQACSLINSGNLPPIQCSYSPFYQETIALGAPGGYSTGASTPASATTGQIYMVLLTNFDNMPGFINFQQTGGTGLADCSIVPLSIHLTSFKVENFKGTNNVSWTTHNLQAINHYTVEHSTDGLLWKSIGTIEVDTDKEDYFIPHYNYKNELNYYRLVEHNKNGLQNILTTTSIDNSLDAKELTKVVNMLGQEISPSNDGIKLYVYTDGTIVKRLH